MREIITSDTAEVTERTEYAVESPSGVLLSVTGRVPVGLGMTAWTSSMEEARAIRDKAVGIARSAGIVIDTEEFLIVSRKVITIIDEAEPIEHSPTPLMDQVLNDPILLR